MKEINPFEHKREINVNIMYTDRGLKTKTTKQLLK